MNEFISIDLRIRGTIEFDHAFEATCTRTRVCEAFPRFTLGTLSDTPATSCFESTGIHGIAEEALSSKKIKTYIAQRSNSTQSNKAAIPRQLATERNGK